MQESTEDASNLELIAPKRKVAISSAYLIPTGAIWKTLVTPTAIICSAGLLNVLLTWGNESRSMERLLCVAYLLLGFWGIHAVLMGIHQWNRRRWLQIISIQSASEFRLSSALIKNRPCLDSRTDPLALKRVGSFVGIGFAEAAFANPLGLICLIAGIGLFPFIRSYHSFTWYIGILSGVIAILSLSAYFAVQKCEILITPVGILQTHELSTEFYPWTAIEEVAWKEPRYDSPQLEIQRAKGAFSLLPSLNFPVEGISEEERDRLIQYLSEHTSVKTAWVREGGE